MNHIHTWQPVPKAGHNLKQCSACLLYIGAVYVPKRKLLTGKIRKELETQLSALRTDHKRGKLDPALKNLSPLTFGEACDRYERLYLVPNKQFNDLYVLPYLKEKIGEGKQVKAIDKALLDEVKAAMLADFAATTFLRRWTLLSSVFRECVPTYLPVNPCKLISNKAIRKQTNRKDTSRLRWFTNEDMQTIYRNLLSYTRLHKNDPKRDNYTPLERRENYLFAVVVRNVGIRADNMVRLEWMDLNLKSSLLTARQTKNGRTYDFVMNTACRAALLELWELKGKPSQGRVFRKANWSRIFTKLFRRLGWNSKEMPIRERAVLHTFRHTFCAHLVMAGYSGKPLWEAMGWENGTEEVVYSHFSPKFKDTMVNTVSCAYEPLGDKLLQEIKGEPT